MITLAIILFYALAFGVLRRTLGGGELIYLPFKNNALKRFFWDGEKVRRLPSLVLMGLLPVFLGFYIGLSWYVTLFLVAFTIVFWNGAPFLPGHRFAGSEWRSQNLYRYGPVSIGWVVADLYWKPEDRQIGKGYFIKGYTTVGEFLAGIIYGALFSGILLLFANALLVL